jgi:REP element-mobilizing transposase RayT
MSNNNKERKNNRMKGYDYSQCGWYFITICTKNMESFFGEINDGKILLNEYGGIAEKYWIDLPNHYNNCVLDEFVIMPNHIHGIVVVYDNPEFANIVGNRHACSLRVKPQYKNIPIIIGSFKSAVSKIIHRQNHLFQWQKLFYDHIIRDEEALQKIRDYIRLNPLKRVVDINDGIDL